MISDEIREAYEEGVKYREMGFIDQIKDDFFSRSLTEAERAAWWKGRNGEQLDEDEDDEQMSECPVCADCPCRDEEEGVDVARVRDEEKRSLKREISSLKREISELNQKLAIKSAPKESDTTLLQQAWDELEQTKKLLTRTKDREQNVEGVLQELVDALGAEEWDKADERLREAYDDALPYVIKVHAT